MSPFELTAPGTPSPTAKGATELPRLGRPCGNRIHVPWNVWQHCWLPYGHKSACRYGLGSY